MSIRHAIVNICEFLVGIEKNIMPSAVPIFKKKLYDEQVIYLIWPKGKGDGYPNIISVVFIKAIKKLLNCVFRRINRLVIRSLIIISSYKLIGLNLNIFGTVHPR